MKHLRYLREWPTEDGAELTERDLADRWDMVVLGEHPDGGYLVDVNGKADVHEGQLADDLPGYRLEGGTAEVRYRRVSDDCKPVCYHQTVYRNPDGDCRSAACVHAERESDAPSRSPKGRGSRPEMEHATKDPEDLIAGARIESSKGRATRMRVPCCQVEDTDVVESEPVRGNRFAGEA